MSKYRRWSAASISTCRPMVTQLLLNTVPVLRWTSLGGARYCSMNILGVSQWTHHTLPLVIAASRHTIAMHARFAFKFRVTCIVFARLVRAAATDPSRYVAAALAQYPASPTFCRTYVIFLSLTRASIWVVAVEPVCHGVFGRGSCHFSVHAICSSTARKVSTRGCIMRAALRSSVSDHHNPNTEGSPLI